MFGNIMAFYLGLNLNLFKPRKRLVNVGDILFLNDGVPERVKVTCFTDTGTLFMNGRFAPDGVSIGETLDWYVGEKVYEIDIEELYYQKGSNPERPAHQWERKVFLMGRWKFHAKNDIHIRVHITLRDGHQNESVFLSIGEPQNGPSPSTPKQ
jgi:hypothetical protein